MRTFLGDFDLSAGSDIPGRSGLLWCPEGLREADAGPLVEVGGRRALEVGCGVSISLTHPIK
jgi:hypothetical protein